MTQKHPGNEPDAGDMSQIPDVETGQPPSPDLPDEEAEKLGDFA